MTYFLINDEAKERIEAGLSKLDLKNEQNGYYTTSKDNPENAVGYAESEIGLLCISKGLTIVEPIFYGSWSGRSGNIGYQDIIFAKKNG